MKVRVLLFARPRQICGAGSLTLELPDGASAADAFSVLASEYPQLEALREGVMLAVNERYAAWDQPLSPGDELALIPPVSGGLQPDAPDE